MWHSALLGMQTRLNLNWGADGLDDREDFSQPFVSITHIGIQWLQLRDLPPDPQRKQYRKLHGARLLLWGAFSPGLP